METKMNLILKNRVEEANKYRQDKEACCLCNENSSKEYLCKDCKSRGWRI